MNEYEEVNFSDQYILRWVCEGDEYVNHITKEMMEDLKAVVSQQEKELAEAGGLIGVLREKSSQQQAEIETLKAESKSLIAELDEGYDIIFDGENYTTKLVEPKLKTLTDEEIEVLASKHLCYQIEGSEVSGVFNFAKAILKKASER